MVTLQFQTKCGHKGIIRTHTKGEWEWECQGKNVKGGVHIGASERNRLYVKIAIADFLKISTNHIKLQRMNQEGDTPQDDVGKASEEAEAGNEREEAIEGDAPQEGNKREERNVSNFDEKKGEEAEAENSGEEPGAGEAVNNAREECSGDEKIDDFDAIDLTSSTDEDEELMPRRSNAAKTPLRAAKSPSRKAQSPHKYKSPAKKSPSRSPHKFKTPPAKKKAHAKPKLEWSPNRKAHCQFCGKRIRKGQLRVGMEREWENGPKQSRTLYYHEKCCETKGQSWQHAIQVLEEEDETQRHLLEEERARLRRRLQKLRLRLHEQEGAKEDGRAMILSLKTIDNIVLSAPTTPQALLKVKGIGKHLLETYGKPILQEVRKFVAH